MGVYYDPNNRGDEFLHDGDPSYTIDQAATQLGRAGNTWNGYGVTGTAATVTYAFRLSAPGTMPGDTSGFSQFTTQQIAAAELALQSWADVANITFVRANPSGYSNDAQMLFGNYSSGMSGAAAFAYLPMHGGDVWVNSTDYYNQNPLVSYGRETLVHEIGHAIGLLHPADYNGSTATRADAVYYEDTRQFTVMSYWSETYTGADFQGTYAAAPLLDDIAAIQRIYGANMSTRPGDTTYGFNSNADRDYFSATDAFSDVVFAVWDAGGGDTLDFSGYAENQFIDLGEGHFSSVGGLRYNVAIAVGAVIENAFGGTGSDTIIGNAANNMLRGDAGADVLDGGPGNDSLYGGTGADTMFGGGGDDIYFVNNLADEVSEANYATGPWGPIKPDQDAGIDMVKSSVSFRLGAYIENLTLLGTSAINGTGNSLANVLTGNRATNILRGGGSWDIIVGGGGADDIYGGAGVDELSGGSGYDDFFFNTALSSATNVDNITDFSVVQDTIYLSRSVFTGVAVNGALSAAAFHLGTAAEDASDRIIYDMATGNIYYDADGNGAGTKVLFAQVAAGTSLSNADFIALGASTTSRSTSVEKDNSSEWQASAVFSFEAGSVLLKGEFVEPAHMLDQQQWSQMQHERLNWSSVDYFSA